jgi:aminoglycoside phosphotransferase (APT) family kinase protein
VHGRSPEQPWCDDELERVLAALVRLADAQAPAQARLRPLSLDVAALATGWQKLAADDGALARAEAAVGPHGAWVRRQLDQLQRWSADAAEACAGHSLVHGDLRADNILLGADAVWLIDWPHAASSGAPWFDLLGMLPSVAMQGGGDPAEIFWSQPTTAGADRDAVRATLAALAAYFLHASVQPAPHGISNLRAFQLGQAVPAISWLRRF